MLNSVPDRKSKFYSSYPSKAVEIADKTGQLGYFEDLEFYVGIGFDKLRKGSLLKDCVKNGGIFHFDKATNTKINAVNFRGNSRLENKQLNMLSYLWELAYDLCIAPADNVSGNAGFEVLLGVN